MSNYTYTEKLAIANRYLAKYGTNWNDLPNINALESVDDREGIISLCDERLQAEDLVQEYDT